MDKCTAVRLLCFALPVLLFAQQTPDLSGVIRSPELADRYKQTATLVRQATASAKEEPAVAQIRREMQEISMGLRDFQSFSRIPDALNASLERGADVLQPWHAVSSRLTLWASVLRRRAEELEHNRSALAQAGNAWTATQQASDNQLPKEVQTRIAALLSDLHTAERETANRRAAVLSLQSEVAEQQIQADVIIEQITTARKQQRRTLVNAESAPIWKEFSSRQKTRIDAPEFALTPVREELRRQYAIDLLRYLVLFCVTVAIFSFLLRRFRRHSETWLSASDSHIQALAIVVTRPVSSAVFLTVAIQQITLRDTLPFMVGIAALAMLVPSLRLLPSLLAKGLERGFYVLAALLVLVDLTKLVPRNSLAYRPSWLALQFAVVAALLWGWHLLRTRATAGTWPRLMRYLTAFSLSLAVFAVIANIIGMVRFSLLLLQLVLYSYYAAVTIRGTVVILTGLVVMALHNERLNSLEFASFHRPSLEQHSRRILNFAGLLAYAVTLLYLTTLLDPFRANLDEFLRTPMTVGAISLSLQNVLAFTLAVAITVLVSSGLRMALELAVYPQLNFSTGQKQTVSKLLHYTILSLGLVVAFGAAGVQFSKIAILAGGLSVGVGLGLQNVVNNFVSGLILLFERPLRVGDIISAGKVEGLVKNIGIRSSTIRSGDGADVIVPNAQLISSELTNWTHFDSVRRVSINVTTENEVDPQRVIEILTRVATKHPLVLTTPEPAALLTGFTGGSLEFSLGFWCDALAWAGLSSELRTQMIDAFREAQINVPSLQQNLRVQVMATHPNGNMA